MYYMLGNSDFLFFLLEGLDHCHRNTLLYALSFFIFEIPYPINDKCMFGNCSTIFNFYFQPNIMEIQQSLNIRSPD